MLDKTIKEAYLIDILITNLYSTITKMLQKYSI
jgi:hypothetical protein